MQQDVVTIPGGMPRKRFLSIKEAAAYLRQMGLWDLRRDESGLTRVQTPLVAMYRDMVAGGSNSVGTLGSVRRSPATEAISDVP